MEHGLVSLGLLKRGAVAIDLCRRVGLARRAVSYHSSGYQPFEARRRVDGASRSGSLANIRPYDEVKVRTKSPVPTRRAAAKEVSVRPTVLLVALPHIHMDISSPCVHTSIEVGDLGKERPGELGKRMEPEAMHNREENLDRQTLGSTTTSRPAGKRGVGAYISGASPRGETQEQSRERPDVPGQHDGTDVTGMSSLTAVAVRVKVVVVALFLGLWRESFNNGSSSSTRVYFTSNLVTFPVAMQPDGNF